MRRFEAGGRRPVTHLRFRPGGAAVTAALRRSAELLTWDLATGACERTAPFPDSPVTCFEYAPDGSALAVGGQDGVARPHRPPDGRCLAELRVGHTGGPVDSAPVFGVTFAESASSGRLWLAAAGAELWLWCPATQEYVVAPEPGQYRAVAFSPDGDSVLAAAVQDGAAIAWRVKPFRELFRVPLRADLPVVRCLRWLPDGESFLVAGEEQVECRDPEGGRWRAAVKGRDGADVAVTPDGRLAAVTDRRTVKLLDVETGAVVREYDWGIGPVSAVAVCPDGTMAAAGGERGQVVVWDLDG